MASTAKSAAAAAATREGFAVIELYPVGGTESMCHCRSGGRCGSPGKHPVHASWQSGPPATLERVEAAWTEHPDRNIGVRTGPASGALVIDLDVKGGVDGRVSWTELVKTHDDGTSAPTRMHRTGSGGYHLIYAWPAEALGAARTITNSAGKLGPGVDVRGEGGYVVWPGSTTPAGAYTRSNATAVADPPGWLVELLATVVEDAVPPSLAADQSVTLPVARPGPAPGTLPPHRADPWFTSVRDGELARLDAMCAAKSASWPDGYAGEPWDAGCFAVACNLIEACNTAGRDVEEVRLAFLARAPRDEGFGARQVRTKWGSAAKRVKDRMRDTGPESDDFKTAKPPKGGERDNLDPGFDDLGMTESNRSSASLVGGDGPVTGPVTPTDPNASSTLGASDMDLSAPFSNGIKPPQSGQFSQGGLRANGSDRVDPFAYHVPSLSEAEIEFDAHRLRVKRAAKDRVDVEEHERDWTPPPDAGPLSQELLLPDNPQPWRIKGLLGAGHNALIVAALKSGKTTLVSELIRSLVDGQPFLGRFEVADPDGAVAMFNYELGDDQYRRWIREVGITNTAAVHLLHLRGRTLPLSVPGVRAWVTNWLREREVKVWIVDPYSRAYLGSVENGNAESEVGRFLDCLDQIKNDAGVSELVMPAHTPKGDPEPGFETAIGSQRLEAWPDAMWYLTRDKTTNLRFLRAYGRDVDVDEEQLSYDHATRRLTFGGYDRAGVKRNAETDELVTVLTTNPGLTSSGVREVTGWSFDRIRRLVAAARGQGRLYTLPASSGTGMHHYVSDIPGGAAGQDQGCPGDEMDLG